MNSDNDHIKWFRASSHYINAHRGRTFVIHLPGQSILEENFTNVLNDIALLYSLNVKLVLVHGAEPQIRENLIRKGHEWPQQSERHITTPEILEDVLATIGLTGTHIEAGLSTGHTPMRSLDILVTSGNFVKARPLGIVDGVDFYHTGVTRRINHDAIQTQLENDAIVIISQLGHSPSGETFILDSQELARDVACSLEAEKLVYFTPDNGIRDQNGEIINELQENRQGQVAFNPDQTPLVKLTTSACLKGVNRCHVISYLQDGALLEELFTRDGSGTQVIRESYDQLRSATPDDVAGIIDLITPLEKEGLLVKRSRELLESEVDHFMIIERDGMIVACAALYPFGSKGELACLATHQDYRNDNYGELLLQAIETNAREQGLTVLFVLTTQTSHWFLERGYSEQPVDELPKQRKLLYNLQRNSKVLLKPLS